MSRHRSGVVKTETVPIGTNWYLQTLTEMVASNSENAWSVHGPSGTVISIPDFGMGDKVLHMTLMMRKMIKVDARLN